ncbi:hypothetical protein BD779DRAFT_736465 [Infundibulicybe gibba]|nr:hypothetical protein BD779DRAFT_736465 [Infundibulicybe gibba]
MDAETSPDTSTNATSQDSGAPLMNASVGGPSRKRTASLSVEMLQNDAGRRKKTKAEAEAPNSPANDVALVEELSQELQCGCCSELVYQPVIVSPCQHFFCGSCCMLWIRNGGNNCPACRGLSTIVTPSRPLQAIIDALLRAAPHKARTERERQQADEIYRPGQSMRLPAPREITPDPDINQSIDIARPCPHCPLGNPHGWRCPQPIPDPNVDPTHAWHLDDGLPPGHAHCGNCENLLAIRAPSTTKCDLCQVSFCGIGVQGRCVAAPLLAQHPHGMSDIGDLIQSPEIYECFDSNSVEVDLMLDYLTAQRLTPRHIYREVVAHIQTQPRGFAPLIELDLFSDMHPIATGGDANPDGPHNKICRVCAAEVLLWGIREWWVRERQRGFLDEVVMKRKDCPDGRACGHQKDLAHAKEFNHIISPAPSASGGLGPQPQDPPASRATTPLPITTHTATSAIPVEHPLTGSQSVPLQAQVTDPPTP